MSISSKQVQARLTDHLFKNKVLDNSFRGFWCEAMLAEALGPDCKIVGDGWFPWDLQIGPINAAFPDRIRIQVKNSAKLQPWNLHETRQSQINFNLTYRRLPSYVDFDINQIPCEQVGFLCDAFVLCHHPENDPRIADHKDPDQWKFFILPVIGPYCAITDNELRYLKSKLATGSVKASTQRRPETLIKGIRGRPPILPVGIEDLTIQKIKQSFNLNL